MRLVVQSLTQDDGEFVDVILVIRCSDWIALMKIVGLMAGLDIPFSRWLRGLFFGYARLAQCH